MPKDIRFVNYNGRYTVVSKTACVYPKFQNIIRKRTNKKMATNIVVTGEPGVGKSYMAIGIARIFEGFKTNVKLGTTNKTRIVFKNVELDGRKFRYPIDKFTVKQIVFTHSQYMDQLIRLRMGKPILFDEPSYSMGKRDWFKELNKALVQTLESQRFLVHPLIIPIINMNLLDKTIRQYLVQFQVHVYDRGKAIVYAINASQSQDKVYRKEICKLYYYKMEHQYCKKDSCLGCKLLGDPEEDMIKNPKSFQCPLFIAQYERKKRSIQYERYEQAKDQAEVKESSELTSAQIEEIVFKNLDQYLQENGRIDVQKMKLFLRNKHKIHLSTWKGYNIRGLVEAAHPEQFDKE
jgi:hypothetical protein